LFFSSEGKISISSRVPDHLLDEIEFSEVQSGGLWKPMTCIARQRISIIVPYRGRKMHLHTLLHYLIPVLMRQLLEFRIFVIEQVNDFLNDDRSVQARIIYAVIGKCC
jgi:hypothetical protein